ncbi:hypothetical protein NLI96_g10119 [Meripilus lineatus]|uniref:Uncharacterized protein n=1 Tax=Meripilus lineatus TaxID=2056292 RepID=A0AAD5YCA3_9APHY|nr:hypothetical protein NLI96_g10119 [Physisporinus lineatus]
MPPRLKVRDDRITHTHTAQTVLHILHTLSYPAPPQWHPHPNTWQQRTWLKNELATPAQLLSHIATQSQRTNRNTKRRLPPVSSRNAYACYLPFRSKSSRGNTNRPQQRCHPDDMSSTPSIPTFNNQPPNDHQSGLYGLAANPSPNK